MRYIHSAMLITLTDSLFEARLLRYLATNHIFKEVAPNVFANNLISSCLDTGKKLEDIRKE